MSIASAVPIPAFVCDTPDRPDLRIEYGLVAWPSDSETPLDVKEEFQAHVSPESIFLYWREFGSARLDSGTVITLDPLPGVGEGLILHLLLGPMLALICRQRGDLVLHASAVARDGIAIAFMGNSGDGKSTTAAAFEQAGWNVLVDDILPLRLDQNPLLVYPGTPHLKLWDAASSALDLRPEAYPEVFPGARKRLKPLAALQEDAGVPLQAVFSLGAALQPEVQIFRGAAACLRLMQYTYGTPYLQRHLPGTHMQQTATAAGRVRVGHLAFPREFVALPEVVAMVERTLGPDAAQP